MKNSLWFCSLTCWAAQWTVHLSSPKCSAAPNFIYSFKIMRVLVFWPVGLSSWAAQILIYLRKNQRVLVFWSVRTARAAQAAPNFIYSFKILRVLVFWSVGQSPWAAQILICLRKNQRVFVFWSVRTARAAQATPNFIYSFKILRVLVFWPVGLSPWAAQDFDMLAKKSTCFRVLVC